MMRGTICYFSSLYFLAAAAAAAAAAAVGYFSLFPLFLFYVLDK